MNIQQQEQWDYEIGMATELQNAFTVSRLERKPDDSAMIEELVSLGRYVVVGEGTEYCPRTDAIMGSRKVLLEDFETYDEALSYVRENPGDEDYSVYIRQPSPVELNPYIPPTDEEIPF